jgi:hypothetical protein
VTGSKAPPTDRRSSLATIALVVHARRTRLLVQLKCENAEETSDSPDDPLLTIPWQKPPSKKLPEEIQSRGTEFSAAETDR